MLSQYPGEVLLLNVVLLAEAPERIIDHLSFGDVKEILKDTGAKAVILPHFGSWIPQANPSELAERLSHETGRKVIAARGGMTFEVVDLLKD